ncbi:metal ABC transporter ATP-binding protein [Mammaliicoccus sciuri]|mgnify:CR=1 FL=1|uniref:Iron/zinc/copper transport system ATP-binding protein n=1 Tax=Sporosarcina newyorkensis TaxID=759851 RepID=A0A1T4YJ48_9BACL|nr:MULTISPECIES: metal ABC transporter ATP-binding protein [Sporosarcina]MBY0222760.1 metal ABC transporter ATP-binding protein [Sporosarcina aquimarina]SKB01295.1 iron/zinc/copper transport system ATP-binding protein [Sporosarcina newyorkensis]
MVDPITVEHISVSYDGNEVVKDISFSFKASSLIGVLGPNGAGKSTLMKAMLGLIHKDCGSVKLGSKSIDEMRKQIAYVPQRSNIDWSFPIVVKDTVLLGTYPKVGLLRRPKKADKEWAMECLKQVGMEEFANRQISELSGGQQQRVFLARALAQKADYFFLDEPFVGIDVSSEEVIIDILRKLKEAGKIVFVVHHDLSKVKNYFDDLVLINKELIDAGPVNKVFQAENMTKAYNRQFMFDGLEVSM